MDKLKNKIKTPLFSCKILKRNLINRQFSFIENLELNKLFVLQSKLNLSTRFYDCVLSIHKFFKFTQNTAEM